MQTASIYINLFTRPLGLSPLLGTKSAPFARTPSELLRIFVPGTRRVGHQCIHRGKFDSFSALTWLDPLHTTHLIRALTTRSSWTLPVGLTQLGLRAARPHRTTCAVHHFRSTHGELHRASGSTRLLSRICCCIVLALPCEAKSHRKVFHALSSLLSSRSVPCTTRAGYSTDDFGGQGGGNRTNHHPAPHDQLL